MSTEFNPMEGLLADLLNTWDDEPAFDSGEEVPVESGDGEAPAIAGDAVPVMGAEVPVDEAPSAEILPVAGVPSGPLAEPEPAPRASERRAEQPMMIAENLPSAYVPEPSSEPQRPRSSRAHEPVPFISALLKAAPREATATREATAPREPLPLEAVLTLPIPPVPTPEPREDAPIPAAPVPPAPVPPAPDKDKIVEATVEPPASTWAEDPGAAASCAAILARMEREFAEREPIYPPTRKRLASDVPRYVIFVLREMVFAIPIGRVLETDRMTPVTPLPGAAPGVKGLTNLRGEVVPVIDLREMLGWGPPENPTVRRMLVINDGHRQPLAALLVDQVKGLAAFPATAWKEAEIAGTHSAEGFVEAVAEREGDWVSRLNLDRILNETHLPSLAAA